MAFPYYFHVKLYLVKWQEILIKIRVHQINIVDHGISPIYKVTTFFKIKMHVLTMKYNI